MKKWQLLGIGLMLGMWTGCAAIVGTSSGVYVPKDSGARCVAQCQNTGMVLSSMVVMANNVGCVCAPVSAPATACSPAATSGAAGGLAALMMQEQQDDNPRRSQPTPTRH
jgi:hypothetical protein